MILIDTSLWIACFQREDPFDLESVVSLDEVVTCGPVVQELLQGFREDRAHERARMGLFNLPWVESPMSAVVFEEAAELYRTGRRRGLTIRSSVDCLIATCAIRNNLEVLHRDRDFGVLAQFCALRQREA